jgi:hypothetical protein
MQANSSSLSTEFKKIEMVAKLISSGSSSSEGSSLKSAETPSPETGAGNFLNTQG